MAVALFGATLRSCEPDQSCFFDAGKNLDPQARFLFDRANELVRIVCFTNRRGRDRRDPLSAMRLRNRAKTLETIYRASSRRFADVPVDECLLAQPDDFAFARDHRKGITSGSFDNDEFE